jgi:ribosome biogenesis GTPase
VGKGQEPGQEQRARSKSLELIQGVVVRIDGPAITIRARTQEVRATLRGGLKVDRPRSRAVVTVGDGVILEGGPTESWVVTSIEPRRTFLARADPGDPRRPQVIAANVDQIVCVHAFRDPPLNLRSLDRLLLLGLAAGVPSMVVANKLDLLHGRPVPADLAGYERIGLTVLPVSARTGAGLPGLAARLKDRVSAIVGPSGAGKSSLLNALVPGLHLRVGAVSESTSRGVHTTVRVEWIDLPFGGAVLDTPGLRSIQPWGVDATRLHTLWPEFQGRPPCRYVDCLHRSEPDCTVRREVESGHLPAFRYDSYLRILASLEQADRVRRRQDFRGGR